MPQVRILSPRCDQKPVPSWHLNRPARGGFLLLTGTCAKAMPKSFHLFRWFGTTSPSVVERDQHLQETWPEQSRNLRYPDPPSSCLHGSGFKTNRRIGTPLRSRRECRCLISGGDGKGLAHPTQIADGGNGIHQQAENMTPLGLRFLLTNGLHPRVGA